MENKKSVDNVKKQLFRKGKEFERKEKSEFLRLEGGLQVDFEKSVPTLPGHRGRIDVLIQADKHNDRSGRGYCVVIEIKSTDWDNIKPHRIRPNVLRHIGQAYKYFTNFHEDGKDVILAVCYPHTPSCNKTRQYIEQICTSQWVQVVWTDEREKES